MFEDMHPSIMLATMAIFFSYDSDFKHYAIQAPFEIYG